MVSQFVKHYKGLGDTSVYKVLYEEQIDVELKITSKTIQVDVLSYNWNENKWQYLELYFKDVQDFVLKQNDMVLNDVFIEDGALITFDFFPVDFFHYTTENSDSPFKIKCLSFEYKVVKDKLDS
ncbi:hypothetical protein [Flavobacterium akiainvivens]|uniref:hypothetical protein n=1 Tax=Flavobacterium akiainvivens TaxID=1202724 RepID=UPI0008F176F8|nr:hypothetical protein [Flavobacterium akiainvivens]SFQ77211.1 hypothetical protein SAMN05444144_12529 [Flavobacterium akiainvivens]